MNDIPYILAIESSCDDTSAAVMQGDKVLSNVIASQKIHQEYGGVVPELASRAHQQHIIPVVHQALQRAATLSHCLHSRAWLAGVAISRRFLCQILSTLLRNSFGRSQSPPRTHSLPLHRPRGAGETFLSFFGNDHQRGAYPDSQGQ